MSNPLSLRSTYTGHPRDGRLKVETPRFIGSGMSRDDVAVEVAGRDGSGAARVMVNGPTLRDHLIERFPIEPVAVERTLFAERKPAAPKFKVGDRVRIVEPFSFYDVVGDVWTVTGTSTFLGEEYVLGTRERDGHNGDRKASRFEKVVYAPKFKAGDVAVRTGAHKAHGRDYGDHEIRPGQRVEILRPATGPGEWRVKRLGERAGESVIHEDGLTLYTEPDPTGAVVYVTGDSDTEAHAGGEHGLAVGTEVTISDVNDYLVDGSYEVTDADGSDYWVLASDLDVEKPFVPVPVGTIVRVVNGGGEAVGRYAPRHYFPIGSLATVERPASRESDSYTLRGVIGGDHIGRGTVGTQFVKAASFEVVK